MTQPSFSGYHRLAIALLALALCSAVVVPVYAATKYTGGSPAFSAAVNGVNEFSPGQEATLQVLVSNNGISSLKQLDRGVIAPEDLPTTAKQVTVGLTSGSNDILVKTDPQMVGSIQGSGSQKAVNFILKITENATAGEYQLPLTIQYQYLRPIEQETADIFQFTYNSAKDTIPLTIRIKPQVKIEILESTPEPMIPGSEGYISFKIQNAGPEDGRMATAKLIRNGKSPIIPTDSTVFLGNFPSGGAAECKYKVSIAKDAMNKTYPVDIAVTYTNREGTIVTSQSTTTGIPVYGKTQFSVVSSTPKLAQGSDSTIEVQYRNNGVVTVYNAQAQITGHSPISSTGNTAFLGDLKSGESATASYEIQVDSGAEAKEYLFDSKIRYRDAFSNSIESDTIPVAIQVDPAGSGSAGGFPGVLIGLIAAIVIIGAGVVLWNHHRSGKMR
ncbi:COG1361 S-layer family protein [Methanoregula sp.]|uniref:COG1361 S-layer family protein n=1 Tax=Methanoregula sp. TaxID=2052170 RepID=UPI003567EC60